MLRSRIPTLRMSSIKSRIYTINVKFFHLIIFLQYAGTLRYSNLEMDLNDMEFLDVNYDSENNSILLEVNFIIQFNPNIFKCFGTHYYDLFQLRQDMIDLKEGEIDLRLKKHFDSMVRYFLFNKQ